MLVGKEISTTPDKSKLMSTQPKISQSRKYDKSHFQY